MKGKWGNLEYCDFSEEKIHAKNVIRTKYYKVNLEYLFICNKLFLCT